MLCQLNICFNFIIDLKCILSNCVTPRINPIIQSLVTMELSSPGRVNHFNEDICSENYTNHQSTPIIFVDSSVVNTNCAEEITEEVNSNHNETNPLEVLCFGEIMDQKLKLMTLFSLFSSLI